MSATQSRPTRLASGALNDRRDRCVCRRLHSSTGAPSSRRSPRSPSSTTSRAARASSTSSPTPPSRPARARSLRASLNSPSLVTASPCWRRRASTTSSVRRRAAVARDQRAALRPRSARPRRAPAGRHRRLPADGRAHDLRQGRSRARVLRGPRWPADTQIICIDDLGDEEALADQYTWPTSPRRRRLPPVHVGLDPDAGRRRPHAPQPDGQRWQLINGHALRRPRSPASAAAALSTTWPAARAPPAP